MRVRPAICDSQCGFSSSDSRFSRPAHSVLDPRAVCFWQRRVCGSLPNCSNNGQEESQIAGLTPFVSLLVFLFWKVDNLAEVVEQAASDWVSAVLATKNLSQPSYS